MRNCGFKIISKAQSRSMESMTTMLKNGMSNAKKLADAVTCADDAAIDALAMVMVLPRPTLAHVCQLTARQRPPTAIGHLGHSA